MSIDLLYKENSLLSSLKPNLTIKTSINPTVLLQFKTLLLTTRLAPQLYQLQSGSRDTFIQKICLAMG
jgi:hypothetical protein